MRVRRVVHCLPRRWLWLLVEKVGLVLLGGELQVLVRDVGELLSVKRWWLVSDVAWRRVRRGRVGSRWCRDLGVDAKLLRWE